jgi:hypothetical protein
VVIGEGFRSYHSVERDELREQIADEGVNSLKRRAFAPGRRPNAGTTAWTDSPTTRPR